MKYYLNGFKNYGKISGRATWTECWSFVLFNAVILYTFIGIYKIVPVYIQDAKLYSSILVGLSIISLIFSLSVFVPTFTVAIRRMHDINKSGWWVLIPIYGLYLCLLPGDCSKNKYGIREL